MKKVIRDIYIVTLFSFLVFSVSYFVFNLNTYKDAKKENDSYNKSIKIATKNIHDNRKDNLLKKEELDKVATEKAGKVKEYETWEARNQDIETKMK